MLKEKDDDDPELMDKMRARADEYRQKGDEIECDEMQKGFFYHLDGHQVTSVPSQRDIEILSQAYYCKSVLKATIISRY